MGCRYLVIIKNVDDEYFLLTVFYRSKQSELYSVIVIANFKLPQSFYSYCIVYTYKLCVKKNGGIA